MKVPDVVYGRFTRLERAVAWSILLLLGGLQALVFADRLNPDGIAYLDIASAYARGDWNAAINPYWSPALSWILAILERPLGLFGCGGLARVHVVMIGIYAFAIWSFERLVAALGHTDAGPDPENRAWRWLTYALFGMVVMQMIGLVWLTPDVLLLGLMCLAMAFGLRTLEPTSTGRTAIAFGGLLGMGFWTKSPLLPLSLVILLIAGWLASGPGRRRVLAAAGTFLVTASVWIVPLSIHEGHPTFGDAGRLNVAWFLGSVPDYSHWTGAGDTGTPVHPLIQADGVEAFAFPEPFAEATYPPWYAPAHWHEGVRPRVLPEAVRRNVIEGLRVVSSSTPSPFVALSVVTVWLLARPRGLRDLRSASLLLVLPAVAGLAGYVAVHVEPRLAAPMLLLGWLGLLAMPRVRHDTARDWFAPTCLGFAVLLTLAPLHDAARQVGWLRTGVSPGRDQDCAIADKLARRGIARGTPIAFVGDASAAAWAWIGGLRIVADMPDAAAYWKLDGDARAGLDRFFARAGATALVAPALPDLPPAVVRDWSVLGATGHLARPLDSQGRKRDVSGLSGRGDPRSDPGSAEHHESTSDHQRQ